MSVADNFFNVLAFSLAFALVGLGVFLAHKVFKITDLTCEASFALGGCTYGTLVVFGFSPVVAMIIAMCLGYFAGFVTSSFINYIQIDSVVAGLITVGGIQTILLKISSGRFEELIGNSIIGNISPWNNLIIAFFIVGVFAFLFYRLMESEYGLSMRLAGNGMLISESMGVDSLGIVQFGLGLENALCALSGALVVQISGHFTPNMGSGILIFGLASIMIGEKLFRVSGIKTAVISSFLGALAYQCTIKMLTYEGMYAMGEEYNSLILAFTLIMLVALRQDSSQKNLLKNY